MFYADAILAKKGPLAHIWHAAHNWDPKKLSKSIVVQTDVRKDVGTILGDNSNLPPLALRLSSLLLLGVVRIYSRKAKYLLDDCSEALLKIKMAFRVGAVDLPAGQAVASAAAITLPDTMIDFDMILPDPDISFANWEDEAPRFSVSRISDITLTVTNSRLQVGKNMELDNVDNFFGFGVADEAETNNWRGLDWKLGDEENAPAVPDIEVGRNSKADMDLDPLHANGMLDIEVGRNQAAVPMSPLDTPRNNLKRPLENERDMFGFGIDEGGGFGDDGFGGRVGDDVFGGEDLFIPELPANNAGDIGRISEFADDPLGGGLALQTPRTPGGADGAIMFETPTLQIASENASAKRQKVAHDDADGQDGVAKVLFHATPTPRKRKLLSGPMVDQRTEIPGKLIQAQIRDTTDIVRKDEERILLPNKRSKWDFDYRLEPKDLAHLLLCRPCFRVLIPGAASLFEAYQASKPTKTRVSKKQVTAATGPEDDVATEEEERAAAEKSREADVPAPPSSATKDLVVLPPINDMYEPPLQLDEPGGFGDVEFGGEDLQVPVMDDSSSHLPTDGAPTTDRHAEDQGVPFTSNESSDPTSSTSAPPTASKEKEAIDSSASRVSRSENELPASEDAVEDPRSLYDETEQEQGEETESAGHKISPVQRLLKDIGKSTTYTQLLTVYASHSAATSKQGPSRKAAATVFFELLVMRTKSYVNVHQSAPFENIDVHPKAKLLNLVLEEPSEAGK